MNQSRTFNRVFPLAAAIFVLGGPPACGTSSPGADDSVQSALSNSETSAADAGDGKAHGRHKGEHGDGGACDKDGKHEDGPKHDKGHEGAGKEGPRPPPQGGHHRPGSEDDADADD